MNLYSVEFLEDIEGNEMAFCWASAEGYDTLGNIYGWAEEQPHMRGVIEVPNEATAKAMIEHSIEAQEDLSSYVFQHRGFMITLQSV